MKSTAIILTSVVFELPITGLNATLPALLVQLTAQGPDYLTGGSDGPEGSVLSNVFFASAIIFIAWRNRNYRCDSV